MKITLIQQVVPHYRVEFFRKLHEQLAAKNISMRLLYGTAARGPADTSQVLCDEWATRINTLRARILGLDIVWQSAFRYLKDNDLVVVEQSNRLLTNYVLMVQRHFSGLKLAYWGHGRNMQALRPFGIREMFKRLLLKRVDWWFAYTRMTRDYLVSRNYPESNITLVNNAVDSKLAEQIKQLSNNEPQQVALELGLSGRNIVLFCGGLYKQKRIDFLLLAAQLIRKQIPDFELLVVGEGPDRSLLEHAMKRYAWIHYAGHVVGDSVAKYWYVSKLLLMPGLVGLAVVDSFNAACPMVTTRYPYHSPEIAYLESGVNGLMTDDDVTDFAQGVVSLLRDEAQLNILRRGCLQSADRYTLDMMAENFADGIERCLKLRISSPVVNVREVAS